MPVVNLCPDQPLPTYKGIYDAIMLAVAELLKVDFVFPNLDYKYPPFDITIPKLPTLPTYGFSNTFGSNLAKLEQFINELVSNQIMVVLGVIFDAIGAIVPINLPKIPVLNVDLVDLMSWDIDTVLPTLDIPIIPGIPSNLEAVAMDKLRTLQTLVANYLKALVDYMVSLLSDIKDILDPTDLIPLVEFPPLPTMEDILALLPEKPTLPDLIALMNSLLPIIDWSTIIPEVILPNVTLGSYDINQAILAVLKKLPVIHIELIVAFLEDLGLSIPLPLVCFPITLG